MKSYLNPEEHQNCISGSKVTVLLLKGFSLPIGGVALGRVCACIMKVGRKSAMSNLIKWLMSDIGFCRTAPAKPGLLNLQQMLAEVTLFRFEF